MVEAKPIVVITGVSGYIGAHVCKKFIDDGGFRVIGTVRDKDNAEKVAPLKKAFGEDLELRSANLLDAASMEKAVEGATYLVHTASPVAMSFATPEEVIEPALQGTIAAVEAAHKHGVKRVVITSSVAAVSTYLDPIPDPITEENWANEVYMKENEKDTKCSYAISKTRAERAAWAYQASMPENERFDLCTICPGLVLGKPVLEYGFASGRFMNMAMEGQIGDKFGDCMPCVEVETVAEAHLQCIKVAEAKNQRYLLVNCSKYFNEIAMPLHAEYGTKGWPVKDGLNPSEEGKGPAKIWQRTKSETVLGLKYAPDYNSVMLEMVAEMIDVGHLKIAPKTE